MTIPKSCWGYWRQRCAKSIHQYSPSIFCQSKRPHYWSIYPPLHKKILWANKIIFGTRCIPFQLVSWPFQQLDKCALYSLNQLEKHISRLVLFFNQSYRFFICFIWNINNEFIFYNKIIGSSPDSTISQQTILGCRVWLIQGLVVDRYLHQLR